MRNQEEDRMVYEGRSALVSGAGTGIGRASAIRLARDGYGVTLVGRRPGPLSDVAAEIAAGGGRAVPVPADVATVDGSEKAVNGALGAFGRLDALVCNHGVGASTAVGDETLEGWESTMRINLTGPFLLARAALASDRNARSDRQHQLDERLVRRPGLGVLLHVEGGADHTHPLLGQRLRPTRRPRELHLSRLGSHSHGR